MPEPIKPTPLKEFVKDRTKIRVDEDGVKRLAKVVNRQLERVIKRVHALAEMEKRKTILLRDMERAVEEVLGKPGGKDEPPKHTPDAVFDTIERYDIEALSDLARQLEASLKN